MVIDLTGESPARITKPKPAPKKPTRFACSTCGRKLAASSFPNKNCTDRCEHSMNTCKACTKTWISAQLESVTYDKLSCPECPAVMDNAHVKKLAAPKVYEKFDQMERRGIAEKIPGWRWCLNPKCRAGQVHKPLVEVSPNLGRGKRGKTKKKTADDICECDTCHAQACVSCDKPWHEGETCAQYQKRMKRQTETEEKATAKFIETKCKKCPNCSKSIEKNGGCDTVFCKYLLIPSLHLRCKRANNAQARNAGRGSVGCAPRHTLSSTSPDTQKAASMLRLVALIRMLHRMPLAASACSVRFLLLSLTLCQT